VSHERLYSYPNKNASIVCINASSQNSLEQNEAGTCRSDWHKSDTACSQDVPAKTKENAAEAGILNGTYQSAPKAKNTPKRAQNAMSAFAKPAHKSVARMLGYVLTLGGDSWFGLRVILRSRLTVVERVALAYQALTALDEEDALEVAKTVFGEAGDPLPAFLAPLADARQWAGYASREELKAYALASFEAMSDRDRSRFLGHIAGRAAA
jgi:hypothetical protein